MYCHKEKGEGADLIQLPVRPKVTLKRKPARKVPTWHLTSEEAMEYIAESNKRTEAKAKKTEEKSKVKHEAVLTHHRKKCQPTKCK